MAVIFIIAGCQRNSSNVKEGSVKETSVIQSSEIGTLADTAGSGQKDNTVPDTSAEARLKGRWQRNDGSYYLQIYTVSADSTLKAGYFNPNPVNVESGEWLTREGRVFMRIILRDVNYPGSTYILEYQRDTDILAGNYFQAVDGVNYEVSFSRVK